MVGSEGCGKEALCRRFAYGDIFEQATDSPIGPERVHTYLKIGSATFGAEVRDLCVLFVVVLMVVCVDVDLFTSSRRQYDARAHCLFSR